MLRRRCAVALAWFIATTSAQAFAHEQWTPNAVNRYVSLAVVDERADVTIRLLFGDLPGLDLRRAMDSDGDGQLSGAELVRERLAWGRRANELVRLIVDGGPQDLDVVTVVATGGEPAVGAHPVEIELNSSLPLSPGERRIQVVLGEPLPRQGETEVSVDFDKGWRLLASQQGQEPPTSPPLHRVTFPASTAGASPSVTFVLRSTGIVSTPRRGGPDAALLTAAAFVAALAAAGAAWAYLRRRRPA